jgi:Arc/MetJ-type ribon-helix-helix transcriptional regulator
MKQLVEVSSQRYAECMSQQIAIRIPDDQLQALDKAIEARHFESRADGVRQALKQLLDDLREQEIALEYRRAYERYPLDPAIGEAGAELLAEAVRREEEGSR